DDIQLMLDDLIRQGRKLWLKYPNDRQKGRKELEVFVRDIRKKRTALQVEARYQARVEKLKNQKKITGVSLFIFGPTHPIRVFLHRLVSSEAFEWTMVVLIILNCLFLGLHSPHVKSSSSLGKALSALDKVFTSIFCFELVIKVIAFGFYESKPAARPQHDEHEEKVPENQPAANQQNAANAPDSNSQRCENAYLKSWWNRLDMLVVIVSVFGLIFPRVTFLRGLRAIRPIRVAIRVKQVKVVVKALIHSLGNVINGVIFTFVVLFIFAIIGAQLFSGRLGRCVAVGQPFALQDATLYPDKDSCKNANVMWVNAGFDFDNVFSALLATFKITNFAHWFEDLLCEHVLKKSSEGKKK
ncbi:hypothetical protein RFI_30014, partial [Reticulomyxa filosa]